MTAKNCLTLAAIFGFLAVLLGAFGAHGLSDGDPGFLVKKYGATDPKLVSGMELPASYKYYQDFQTGVRYHMWHALAMFGVGLLLQRQSSRMLRIAAWCFAGGIVFFSGSLYVLVIGGPRFAGVPWGMVAPLGGTLQLVGWVVLAVAVRRLSAGGEAAN